MAKIINLTFKGNNFLLGITKLDRKKIYGYTDVEVRDDSGSKCSLASISDDGKYILSKGCVSYTSLNKQNEYIASNKIAMVDQEGNPLEKISSSFNIENIKLEQTCLDDYLKLDFKGLYQLSADNEEVETDALLELLKTEKLLRFHFNYRTDYDEDDAFILQRNGNIFMVIGTISPFEFIGLEKVIEEEVDLENDDDDDFDFGML